MHLAFAQLIVLALQGRRKRMRSARRIDVTGSSLEPIDSSAISNAWHTLQAWYPDGFGAATLRDR